MSKLVALITSPESGLRDQALDSVCQSLSLAELLAGCEALEQLRRQSDNLYQRVRALFFLSAIHRYHIPSHVPETGTIPFHGYEHLLSRRFEEAISQFRAAPGGPNAAISSALSSAYRGLGFQTLADQVRRSVRSVAGNQWMFRTGHPADYPLRLRPELTTRPDGDVFPVLRETTPVRMDLTHSGWSDIFFLGMDYPEGARVVNISIDLAAGSGTPRPPVEAYLRVIEEPVLRLTSIDLKASSDVSTLAGVFDFAQDYLGLLKAALIAAGIVPPGMEGAGVPLAELLARLTGTPGHGIEVVSKVNDIPKGSRLAVSTNLLACLISVCMRATGQSPHLTGPLDEADRRLIAARAILGEWLGGSGGGWQDSGGVWPGIKLIQGETAKPGDVEFGVSRGRLLPIHEIYGPGQVSAATRQRLQESLILVHGGMAQDVGPILEMVTERYLLRSAAEWVGRREAVALLDEMIDRLKQGDIEGIGRLTQRNFDGPIQTIIPWASNAYTQRLIDSCRTEFGDRFWGFWMLGGMAGGGMGFLFHPDARAQARKRLPALLAETKQALEGGVPFAMEPVVYDFAINERGSSAELLTGGGALMPAAYYPLVVPGLLKQQARALPPSRRAELDLFGQACRTRPEFSGTVQNLMDHLLPRSADSIDTRSLPVILDELGFDRAQHEQIRADLRSGRIGLAQNRLPATAQIEDVREGDVTDLAKASAHLARLGMDALAEGAVGVVSLAGGVGSRWTRGAGVVKALNPFVRMAGRHRSFLDIHVAKTRAAARRCGRDVPHVVTTSYLTHAALARESGPYRLSPGRFVGLRLIPMARDLRFAWEEMPQQLLDVQAQKVRESLRGALLNWATQAGEGNDYTDNLPAQCLHPVGHWYEVPNLLRNGVLAGLLNDYPRLRHLMVHNIDTLGANLDPAMVGFHVESGAALTTELIARQMEDRGGGLARVDGRLRLVEGLAMPNEELEFVLTYYNTGTIWVDIEQLLAWFGLTKAQLADESRVAAAVRQAAARMPAYITLKDVKKRWGKGQEDVFPVAQFERLWGDMTAISELKCAYAAVPRRRGQQLKEPAQLDGWLRDGSANYVESLGVW